MFRLGNRLSIHLHNYYEHVRILCNLNNYFGLLQSKFKHFRVNTSLRFITRFCCLSLRIETHYLTFIQFSLSLSLYLSDSPVLWVLIFCRELREHSFERLDSLFPFSSFLLEKDDKVQYVRPHSAIRLILNSSRPIRPLSYKHLNQIKSSGQSIYWRASRV